jgi:hypothetical protein
MNRKKILICLNGQDDALLENKFVERHLDHPQNLLVKFHLESIEVEDMAAAYVPLQKESLHAVRNNGNGQYAKVLQKINDIHKYSGSASSKRQVIHSTSVKELLTESLYADLLIIRNANYQASCVYYGQKRVISEIFKKAGCPVLVIPDQLSDIEQILLIYDGSPTALMAIKSLRNNLSPLCQKLPVTVLIPCSNGAPVSSSEEKMLIEYLRLHFKDLGIHKICEESAHTMHFAIDPQRNLMIVINHPEQALPDFIEEELLSLREAHAYHYFQFLVNSCGKS